MSKLQVISSNDINHASAVHMYVPSIKLKHLKIKGCKVLENMINQSRKPRLSTMKLLVKLYLLGLSILHC